MQAHSFARRPQLSDRIYHDTWVCTQCGVERLVHHTEQPLNTDSNCPGFVRPPSPPPHSAIEATLAERGSRYGSFAGHANITQRIKRAMVDSPNWMRLADDQREALDMVAHKIGRILNGDPDYLDSWVDIEGYVHLVTQRLNDTTRKCPY